MEFGPEEKKIVDLLAKLKKNEGNYPGNLLESRRQAYLSQIASIGAGVGIGAGIKTVTKTPKAGVTGHLSTISAGTLVEAVLVVAIVVQASFVVYNYRDRIAGFFRSLAAGSPVEEGVPALQTVPAAPGIVVSDTLAVTGSSTDIPSVTVTVEPPLSESGSGSQGAAVTETPQPGNPGHHYGQTPGLPKSTKENNNSNPTKAKDTGGNKKP